MRPAARPFIFCNVIGLKLLRASSGPIGGELLIWQEIKLSYWLQQNTLIFEDLSISKTFNYRE
jgi:hypothetical protein